MEAGETIFEAARRELGEELGIGIGSVGDVQFSINDSDSDFMIEFHPVEMTGDPECLEHEQLAGYPATNVGSTRPRNRG